jgi:hypothetical protein
VALFVKALATGLDADALTSSQNLAVRAGGSLEHEAVDEAAAFGHYETKFSISSSSATRRW